MVMTTPGSTGFDRVEQNYSRRPKLKNRRRPEQRWTTYLDDAEGKKWILRNDGTLIPLEEYEVSNEEVISNSKQDNQTTCCIRCRNNRRHVRKQRGSGRSQGSCFSCCGCGKNTKNSTKPLYSGQSCCNFSCCGCGKNTKNSTKRSYAGQSCCNKFCKSCWCWCKCNKVGPENADKFSSSFRKTPYRYKIYLRDPKDRAWGLDREGILRMLDAEDFVEPKKEQCCQSCPKCQAAMSCCVNKCCPCFLKVCQLVWTTITCKTSKCKQKQMEGTTPDFDEDERGYDQNNIYLIDTNDQAWALDEEGILQRVEDSEESDESDSDGGCCLRCCLKCCPECCSKCCMKCCSCICWIQFCECCKKRCTCKCKRCSSNNNTQIKSVTVTASGEQLNKYDPNQIYLTDTKDKDWALDSEGILRKIDKTRRVKLKEPVNVEPEPETPYNIKSTDPRVKEINQYLLLNYKISKTTQTKYIFKDLVPWTDPFMFELLCKIMEEESIAFRYKNPKPPKYSKSSTF